MAKNDITFEGIIANGHLPGSVRLQISDAMRRAEGKRVRIALSEVRRRRSSNQNSFYWGVVIPAVKELIADYGTDADEEEVHAYLKEHVGGFKMIVTDPSGVKKTIPGSSRKLSTYEFEAYLEKIRAWAAQFDFQIPLPNEMEIAEQNQQAAESEITN